MLSGPLGMRGTSLYTVSLARELKNRGHRVAVLGPGGLFEGVLEDYGLLLLRAPVHGQPWRDFLYLGSYTEAARGFGPDIIHVMHQDHGRIGTWISRRLDVPCVLSVHAQIRERLPFDHPAHVIAVSEDVRQSLVTAGQIPRERITVVPNGVSSDLSALERDDDTQFVPVVGTVNRLDRNRGIDLFLDTARMILDKGAAAHFLIIGEGPLEPQIRAQARKLELTPHLTIALPRSRTGALFRPMNVYVSATHSEGHGIFILSAMAQARPVICSGVGGVLTFIRDGENGLVVPRGDVPKLASKVLYLLENREEARRIAREGFRTVREEYPLSRMVSRTLQAYDLAIEQRAVEESALRS